ncbi:hypothetical protein HG537_0B07060 [Torulaspora globosa]|uniref:Uncharacterized protein n=1 Tax=Torulaspora globosa TaxID=48254 RepID=A0A7H9HQ75_9SACH|nr:hypothetical protein HG537_0B07060 [Torulaspora sp. CBS 2947]
MGFTGSFRGSLLLYGVDIHFCPWEVFTAYGKCKNCLKDRYLCLCPPGTRGKSYRDIAIEILAVHRIILNDEKNEVHLKKIEPYFKDPFPYLDQFYKKKEKFYQKVLLKYYWYLNLLSSEKPIRALESVKGVSISGVFSKTAVEINESYSNFWHQLKKNKINVPELFFKFEWSALPAIWELQEDQTEKLVECPDIVQIFDRIRDQSSARSQGAAYLKSQFGNQHSIFKQEYTESMEVLLHMRDTGSMDNTSSFPHWNIYLLMQIGLFYNAPLMKRVLGVKYGCFHSGWLSKGCTLRCVMGKRFPSTCLLLQSS